MKSHPIHRRVPNCSLPFLQKNPKSWAYKRHIPDPEKPIGTHPPTGIGIPNIMTHLHINFIVQFYYHSQKFSRIPRGSAGLYQGEMMYLTPCLSHHMLTCLLVFVQPVDTQRILMCLLHVPQSSLSGPHYILEVISSAKFIHC